MPRNKSYKKKDIERILAGLLVDEEKLGKWHSPKGVFRRRDAFTLHYTKEEGWVLRHLAKQHKMEVVGMMKWLIVHYFYKKHIPQEMLLKAENYVPVKTRQWLYGFAVRQLKKIEEEPKPKVIITKKMLTQE